VARIPIVANVLTISTASTGRPRLPPRASNALNTIWPGALFGETTPFDRPATSRRRPVIVIVKFLDTIFLLLSFVSRISRPAGEDVMRNDPWPTDTRGDRSTVCEIAQCAPLGSRPLLSAECVCVAPLRRPLGAYSGWGASRCVIRGEGPVDSILHGRWKTITLLAGLHHDAIVASFVIDGPLD
jgi:hypothetical protein